MRNKVGKDVMLMQFFNVLHHLTHKSVGGVTTGQWTVGLPRACNTWGERLMAMLQQQSTRRADKELIAPGISATGWVRRPLSVLEVADTFDMARHVAFNWEVSEDMRQSITGAAQGKVLQFVTELCLSEELSQPWGGSEEKDLDVSELKTTTSTEVKDYQKAVKVDDVEVEVAIWNNRLEDAR
eukprot:10608695-Ditylum_brightwellii.AAC.1